MDKKSIVRLSAMGVIVAMALALAIPGDSAEPRPARFSLSGQLTRKPILTVADLAVLPSHTLAVTFQSGNSPVTRTFTGPLLLDVLEWAGPRFNDKNRNDRLRFYVSATAFDNYKAIVAWGEIDPGFENKQVLLAAPGDPWRSSTHARL